MLTLTKQEVEYLRLGLSRLSTSYAVSAEDARKYGTLIQVSEYQAKIKDIADLNARLKELK